MTCTAKTRGGRPCRRAALRGREVCHAHSGATVGRPSALTPQVHDKLVRYVKMGCAGEIAAQAAGISATTYYAHKKAGREQDCGPERELAEAVAQARAEAYAHAMGSLRRDMAQPGNWRAALAYIDRFDLGRFSDGGEGSHGSRGPAASDAGAPSRRPDLSRLSEQALSELEALGAEEEA